MASLAEILLGKENPVTQWTGRNSNLLTGLGTSLLSDGMNFQPAQAGAMMDREMAAQKDADAKLAATSNATKTWLSQNYPDLAQAVDAGLPVSDAWQEAFKRQQPGYGQPEMTASMRDFQFAQANPGYADFLNPPKAASMPTSYQEFLLSQSDPAYASTLNSSTSRPLTEGQRRNQQLGSVVEPLVSTVVENWSELTNPANQSIGFDTPIGAPGYALTSPGYQKATNALKTIAQSYLYSVSGAAATDAETKKIVDSVTPKFGESEESANEKKALLARYVQAIVNAGGGEQAAGGGMPTVADKATYDALPPGTRYLAPDGTTRTKP